MIWGYLFVVEINFVYQGDHLFVVAFRNAFDIVSIIHILQVILL